MTNQLTAFCAIAAVMAVSCLFGWSLHKVITRAHDSLSEPPSEPDRRTCDTCRYGKVRPQDDPCCDCLSDDDIDRWEAME